MLQVTSTSISLSDSHKVKKMRNRLQSGLRGLLSGGLWSGIVSAILFGLRAYFGDSSSTLYALLGTKQSCYTVDAAYF